MSDADLFSRLALLRNVSLFAQLSDEKLRPVAQVAESRHWEAGEAICRQGEAGTALYIVREGRMEVRVAKSGELEAGDLGAAVATLEKGQIFGEVALLDGSPRSASVIALEDAETLQISDGALDELLDIYPEIATGIIAGLVEYLRR
jgi:CRP/FNR family transcriptional regulator, cyclic AMP receptor protein